MAATALRPPTARHTHVHMRFFSFGEPWGFFFLVAEEAGFLEKGELESLRLATRRPQRLWTAGNANKEEEEEEEEHPAASKMQMRPARSGYVQ